jgi:hypothetical protein
MGLLLPGGPCFQFCVDPFTGTPVATTPGTSIGSGASNADGTAVTLLSALAQDIQYLVVGVAGLGVTTAEDNSCLLDVLVDPSGGTSWASLIDDIGCGSRPAQTAVAITMHTWFHFPLFVKAGSSIGARCRKNGATASTGRVMAIGFGQPKRPDLWWCGQGVETLGNVAGTSKGTAVTAGNSGALGSYTTIGTSTKRYGAIQLGVNSSDNTALAVAYHFWLAVNSAKLIGAPAWHVQMSTAEVLAQNSYGGPVWCDIPSGATIQAVGTCSGTAEALTLTTHGVF